MANFGLSYIELKYIGSHIGMQTHSSSSSTWL